MAKVPTKEEFVKIFNDLQEVVDVDDSAGRSVPINMNFVEEGYLTKDKGCSLFGGTAVVLTHSEVNYKKKSGTSYRLRAAGTYLQKYVSGVWTNLSTGTATVTIASPGVVTSTAHGLKAGSKVSFETTGALPTGITAGTVYYVISAGLTADAFQFSTSAGGAAVDTSGSQSGTHTMYRRYTADAEFGWEVYDDVLYGCNANEFYFKYDGSTFVEYETAPKGNLLEIFEDRMFVSGVTAEPLTVYYSDVGDATTFGGSSLVQPLGTDSVTNLKNYYGVLMIFKDQSIWKLTFVYDQVLDAFVPKLEVQSGNYGACSNKAVSWVENDLWFFTGKEVRALGFRDTQTGQFGVNKSVISEPIKETLALLSNSYKTKIATFYHNRRFYLSVPLENAFNDTVFVCHTLYKNLWTKYTDRIKAYAHDFVEVDDVVYSSKSTDDYGTIKWEESLTADNSEAIISEVFFRKVENKDFDTFNTYRYIDLLFKDLVGTVTLYLREDRNDNRSVSNKAFYVGTEVEGEENTLGEVTVGQLLYGDAFGEDVDATPFLRRRISILSKSQSVTIGLYNSSATDEFTIAAFGLYGWQQPRRLFSKSKIIGM